MTRWLLNSAVIPAGAYGQYSYAPATEAEAATLLREPGWVSRIGYQQTADYLRRISGVAVPLSRESSPLEPGDVALVARLRYRVDPAAKASHEPSEWELGWLRRIS